MKTKGIMNNIADGAIGEYVLTTTAFGGAFELLKQHLKNKWSYSRTCK